MTDETRIQHMRFGLNKPRSAVFLGVFLAVLMALPAAVLAQTSRRPADTPPPPGMSQSDAERYLHKVPATGNPHTPHDDSKAPEPNPQLTSPPAGPNEPAGSGPAIPRGPRVDDPICVSKGRCGGTD